MHYAVVEFLKQFDGSKVLKRRYSKLLWALCSDANSINLIDWEIFAGVGEDALAKLAKNLKPAIKIIWEKLASGGQGTMIVIDPAVQIEPFATASAFKEQEDEGDYGEEGQSEEEEEEGENRSDDAAVAPAVAPAEPEEEGAALELRTHEGKGVMSYTNRDIEQAKKHEFTLVMWMEYQAYLGLAKVVYPEVEEEGQADL